ncbi:uncharacterized protein VSU04_001863 [Chlamydotis macqueenii]
MYFSKAISRRRSPPRPRPPAVPPFGQAISRRQQRRAGDPAPSPRFGGLGACPSPRAEPGGGAGPSPQPPNPSQLPAALGILTLGVYVGVYIRARNGGAGAGKGPPRGNRPRLRRLRPSARCQGKLRQPDPVPTAAWGPVFILEPKPAEPGGPEPRGRFPIRRALPEPTAASLVFPLPGGRMALVLGAVLLAAGAAAPPGVPAPRDLARSVLETHGQELRLLKLLGVARTTFDWGTHFSINFTARQPACPKNLPERRGAGCRTRPGRVQRCAAQVSVFAFLPDVPLSMVECGREPQPSGGTHLRATGAPRAFGAGPGHPSSPSSSSRPPARASLRGTPPLSPTEPE